MQGFRAQERREPHKRRMLYHTLNFLGACQLGVSILRTLACNATSFSVEVSQSRRAITTTSNQFSFSVTQKHIGADTPFRMLQQPVESTTRLPAGTVFYLESKTTHLGGRALRSIGLEQHVALRSVLRTLFEARTARPPSFWMVWSMPRHGGCCMLPARTFGQISPAIRFLTDAFGHAIVPVPIGF